jgi:hypothetical protein
MAYVVERIDNNKRRLILKKDDGTESEITTLTIMSTVIIDGVETTGVGLPIEVARAYVADNIPTAPPLPLDDDQLWRGTFRFGNANFSPSASKPNSSWGKKK